MAKPRVGNNPLLPFIKDSSREASPQAKPQADEKADRQAEKKASTQAKKKAKPEANPQANLQANKQAKTQASLQAVSHADRKARLEANPQADMQAGAIKERVEQGARPVLLADSRTRRTYWLTSADIEKIDLLAKEAGLSHYQIVGAAVSLLYEYVFKEEGEQ
jgi:hypothetical protein